MLLLLLPLLLLMMMIKTDKVEREGYIIVKGEEEQILRNQRTQWLEKTFYFHNDSS